MRLDLPEYKDIGFFHSKKLSSIFLSGYLFFSSMAKSITGMD